MQRKTCYLNNPSTGWGHYVADADDPRLIKGAKVILPHVNGHDVVIGTFERWDSADPNGRPWIIGVVDRTEHTRLTAVQNQMAREYEAIIGIWNKMSATEKMETLALVSDEVTEHLARYRQLQELLDGKPAVETQAAAE